MQAGNGVDLMLLVQVFWVAACVVGMAVCLIRSSRKEDKIGK